MSHPEVCAVGYLHGGGGGQNWGRRRGAPRRFTAARPQVGGAARRDDPWRVGLEIQDEKSSRKDIARTP